MKAFLDTSVLVATFYGDHQHHEESIRLFTRQNAATGCTAAHCLAEVYSVVTSMPGKNRASAGDALLFLFDVRERLSIVTLEEAEYFAVLETAAAGGIAGGTIYDALIARCAVKAKAQTIYTWSMRHFSLLGAAVASRVKAP